MSRLLAVVLLTSSAGCDKYRDAYLSASFADAGMVRDAAAADSAPRDEEGDEDEEDREMMR